MLYRICISQYSEIYLHGDLGKTLDEAHEEFMSKRRDFRGEGEWAHAFVNYLKRKYNLKELDYDVISPPREAYFSTCPRD